jgi:hypothetical protein
MPDAENFSTRYAARRAFIEIANVHISQYFFGDVLPFIPAQ